MADRVEVALALVCDEGRWLVSRRSAERVFAGLWEFPGGKMMPGEPAEAAAVRETSEETGLQVEPVGPAGSITTYHDGKMVVLHLVRCRVVGGIARPADASVAEVRWVSVDELRALQMPPANAGIIRHIANAHPSGQF